MKKILIPFTLLFIVFTNAKAQDCGLIFKDGTKLALNIQSWTNPLISDPKFIKQKQEKKDEQITAYNADVLAGKVPAAPYPLTYTVTTQPGNVFIETVTINGVDYKSQVICTKDTLYFYRNAEPVKLEANGEILGYSLQGVQKLPTTVKVGDILPTFEDISFTFPKTTDKNIKAQVFSHNATSTKTETRDYQSGGDLMRETKTTTTTYAVYNTIDVNLRESLSFSNHFIHYMNAVVVDSEKVTVNGKEYTAYVIESESWSKGVMTNTYESANKEVAAAKQKEFDKAQAKLADKMHRKWGFTNELGYMVMYKKEWYVPAIGMVKVMTYDNFGGIASLTTVDLK